MNRASSGLFVLLSLPLLGGCPQDAAPIDEGTTTGTSDPTTEGSTSIDPDSSTSVDPVTTTTVDPDTGTTTEESGTTEDSSSSTTEVVGCGDGAVDLQAGEVCDGANLDGRDCLTEDFGGGVLACNPDCTLDTSGCTYECGDREVQGDEQCEGNDLDGGSCLTEGFDGGDLGCNADCTYDLSGCENYVCGDGLRAGPETCDGADLDGEDCVTLGFDSGTLTCLGDCSGFDTSQCYVCGNGVIDAAEDCDGNQLGGATCVSEGLEGGQISCASDCTFDLTQCVGCGNGDADPGEECDGEDFDGVTCLALGFVGGQPSCTPQCTISDVSCSGLHTFCTSPASAIGPGVASTQSTIAVAGLAGSLRDVDVLIEAGHTRVSDLDIDVRHVEADLSVSLADDQCGAANDIDATFDQSAAAPPDCVEPTAIEGNVLPLGSLDDYLADATVGTGNGTWELTIADQAANEGGTLVQWCVAITTGCGDDLVTEALAVCAAEYSNCVIVDGGVVGWDAPSCQGCNCDAIEDPWRFYCTEDDANGANYNCSACTAGEILAGHNPCNCNPGTSPVVGNFC